MLFRSSHEYLLESVPLQLEEHFKEFKEICPDGKTIQAMDCDKEHDNLEISMGGVVRKLYCYSKLREKILRIEKAIIQNSNESKLAIEWYEKGMAAAKAAKDDHSYRELQAAYEDLVY